MPDDAPNRLRWLCIAALLLGFVLHLAAAPRLQHGLTATYFDEPDFNDVAATRLERVAMLSSNDVLVSRDRPFSVRWEGFLWVDKTREIAFTIPDGVDARLLLGGELVFQSRSDRAPQASAFAHALSRGSHALTLELVRADAGDDFFSANLEWDTLLGKRLISPTFLYPSLQANGQAHGEMRRAQTRNAALSLGALAILGLLGLSIAARRHSLQRGETWGLLFVVGVALGLRLIYLHDLITHIPNFDALPVGSDHRTYEAAARDLVRGLWPPRSEFYRQPGFPWLLGNFHALLGPDMRPFQIVQLTGGALASMAIYALGKRIFSPPAAWVAALLWATFPLAIFYDAQLVTHGLEAQLVVWLLWLWLSAIERPGNGALIALGLLSGGAAIIRPALLALIPLVALSLIWMSRPRWHLGTARGLILVGIAALPILPVTLHNYRQSGRLQIISANGPVTLYLGNNRDSAGIGQYSQAFRATHERVNRGEVTFVGATLADISASPRRWLGLMVRKTALYFGNQEIPNNVDFDSEGAAISPLLHKTPLRFGTIVVLGFAGLGLALFRVRAYRPGIWLLSTVLLILCSTTVMFHVVSRFRVPTYGPLILFSAFALVDIGRRLASRDVRTSALSFGLLGGSSVLVIALPWVADSSIPLPTLVAPSAESVQVRTVFGETLELSGYVPLAAVEPGEPLFVTLYWEPNSPLSVDYYGTVQLLAPSGEKLTQMDQRLGTGSFPHHPTTGWRPGETVVDQYLLFAPRDAPTPLVLTVLVAVYNRETDERLGETSLRPLPLTLAQPLILPDNVTPVQATIGPALLAAYQAEIENDELALTLFWESIAPASVAGMVFVHLFDSSGDFVLGQDSPPRWGEYPMTAWQPGEGIVDPRRIPLSELSGGEYAVFVGAYDPAEDARLPMVDKAGNGVPNASLKLFQFHFD
ncbi:MAG TPA: glycosyltransferase family 39 protein [Anaerolineales bacterium]|jgi:4-amino-4-deoxy-L-arabinose transferase-like glycosyltransferase|nr:glycosyltransferase family 39 protein [Anaerolineales bacterium]